MAPGRPFLLRVPRFLAKLLLHPSSPEGLDYERHSSPEGLDYEGWRKLHDR